MIVVDATNSGVYYPGRLWSKLSIAFYGLGFPSHVTELILSLSCLIQQADQILLLGAFTRD